MDRQPQRPSPVLDQNGDVASARRRRRRGWTAGAVALSLAAHLSLVAALLLVHVGAPRVQEPATVTVDLVRWKPPAPPAPPKPQTKPAAAKPPPPRRIETPIPPPPDIKPLAASRSKSVESGAGLSDAELEGAATAGSGSGSGGSCDMARQVQEALRKDPLVRAAASTISGKAVMVWNGDWVRSNAEDGKGLAAVREAIIWEIAFAPPACRAQPVHGLVMISLNEPPLSTRLVLGQGQWRWSDLLTPRRYVGEG